VPARTFELVQAGCFSEQVKDLADHVLDHWDASRLETDAALNSAIAATHIALAAHALGLGCCWIKLCRDDEVLDVLGVPPGYYHAGTLAIGFPDEEPRARPRLPLSVLVHRDTFDGDGAGR
jgi:nitroreductase